MSKSKCCKENIFVYTTGEGTSFYVCERCNMATDPFYLMEENHDARSFAKMSQVNHET